MTVVSRFVFFNQKKKTQLSSNRIRTNEISIVIPVKDNQRGVDNYLSAFFLSHPTNHFPKEIIIVDNNSINPVEIDNSFLSKGLSIKIFNCKKQGPAAARNVGVSNATGEWILFNDSDCIPTNTLLTGYLETNNGSVAYAGNIKALEKSKLAKYYDSQEILLPLKIYDESGIGIPQYLITANALVWRKAFVEIDGFNEEIEIAGGEDIDLGLRLSQIGNLSYALKSVTLHDFNDGLIGFCKRFKRYGKGNRFIEKLWQTNMKPYPFRPNNKTLFNGMMALLQYLFLLGGYFQEDIRMKLKK